MPTTQEACMQYISHVLGFSAVIPACLNRMRVIGGNTIAGYLELPNWST